MKSRHFLVGFLIAIAFFGALEGYQEAQGIRYPGWLPMIFTVIFSVLIFGWYYLDSNDHSYQRSRLLNIAVVALALVAIPYYLVQSREKGQKLKAIFKAMGLGVWLFVSVVIGVIVGGVIG
jgi:fucose 4-O-acetylase-like acetyltransferase